MKRIGVFQGGLLGALVLSMSGCVSEFPSLVDSDQVAGSLVVGRVLTALTGKTSRRYPPEVRFFGIGGPDVPQAFLGGDQVSRPIFCR